MYSCTEKRSFKKDKVVMYAITTIAETGVEDNGDDFQPKPYLA